ncbi:hypothetical protein EXU57_24565 [Segetibacter sp. 3557_3]|uniref:hypothetical protein n=1 Tax=Segetibacter sp. 3557_3 TaxID=2547429 RepID=UPI00105902E1|nr:hypothetical protein [Segetibacter sp. 3557_3]TDH18049.1 hypothetical protein EXU57_24565 [Segetibacter sp. 3557_3]
MSPKQIKEKIDHIFTLLKNEPCLATLNAILTSEGIDLDFIEFRKKYPILNFQISPEEVQQLTENGILTSEYTLNLARFSKLNTLSRLLNATLLKNGHIDRLQHIAKGISAKEPLKASSPFVFHQFGRSLADDSEPIVDRHVLRAFQLSQLSSKHEKNISNIRSKKNYNSDKDGLLIASRDWFRENPRASKSKRSG